MSCSTRLGNLGNILDEDDEPERDAVAASRPVVLNAEFEAMREYMGEHGRRDRLHLRRQAASRDACARRIDRIRKRGRGRRARAAAAHIVLTDENVGADARRASR